VKTCQLIPSTCASNSVTSTATTTTTQMQQQHRTHFSGPYSTKRNIKFFTHSMLQLYILLHTDTHPTILRPLFPGLPGRAGARRKLLLDFIVQGLRGRHTQNQAGRHSIQTNPPPSSPHFYAGCPSCHNPPNLSWLGTCHRACWLAYPVAWATSIPSGMVCIFY